HGLRWRDGRDLHRAAECQRIEHQDVAARYEEPSSGADHLSDGVVRERGARDQMTATDLLRGESRGLDADRRWVAATRRRCACAGEQRERDQPPPDRGTIHGVHGWPTTTRRIARNDAALPRRTGSPYSRPSF